MVKVTVPFLGTCEIEPIAIKDRVHLRTPTGGYIVSPEFLERLIEKQLIYYDSGKNTNKSQDE